MEIDKDSNKGSSRAVSPTIPLLLPPPTTEKAGEEQSLASQSLEFPVGKQVIAAGESAYSQSLSFPATRVVMGTGDPEDSAESEPETHSLLESGEVHGEITELTVQFEHSGDEADKKAEDVVDQTGEQASAADEQASAADDQPRADEPAVLQEGTGALASIPFSTNPEFGNHTDDLEPPEVHLSAGEQLQMADAVIDQHFEEVRLLVELQNPVATNDARQGTLTPVQDSTSCLIFDFMQAYHLNFSRTALTCHPNGFHSLPAAKQGQELSEGELAVQSLQGLEIFVEVNRSFDETEYSNTWFFDVNGGVATYMNNLKAPNLLKRRGKHYYQFVVLHAEVDMADTFVDALKLCLFPSDSASLDHLSPLLQLMQLKPGLLATPGAFWGRCHAFLNRDMAACQKKGAAERVPAAALAAYTENVWPLLFPMKIYKSKVEGHPFIHAESLDSFFLSSIVLGAYVGPHRVAGLGQLLKANPPSRQECQAAAGADSRVVRDAALDALMRSINIREQKKAVPVDDVEYWLSKLPQGGESLLGVLCQDLDFAERQLVGIQATVGDMQEGRHNKQLLLGLLEKRLQEIHEHRTGDNPGKQLYFSDLTDHMTRHALALKVMSANVELRRTAAHAGGGASDSMAAAVLAKAPSHCELIARLKLGNPKFQQQLNGILAWHSERAVPPGDSDPWEGLSRDDAVERYLAAAQAAADRLMPDRPAEDPGEVGGPCSGPGAEKKKDFVVSCMLKCIIDMPEKDCDETQTIADTAQLYLGLCHSAVTWKFLAGDAGRAVFRCTVCYFKSSSESKEENFRDFLGRAYDGCKDAGQAPSAIEAGMAFLASHASSQKDKNKRRKKVH